MQKSAEIVINEFAQAKHSCLTSTQGKYRVGKVPALRNPLVLPSVTSLQG